MMAPDEMPEALARWAGENSYDVHDYGDGTYKVSCGLCGPLLRDAPLEDVEQYAREHPTNPCLDLIEWETEVKA